MKAAIRQLRGWIGCFIQKVVGYRPPLMFPKPSVSFVVYVVTALCQVYVTAYMLKPVGNKTPPGFVSPAHLLLIWTRDIRLYHSPEDG